MAETITPSTFQEAAAALGGAAAAGQPVRLSGGGSKLGWGGRPPRHATRLSLAGLSRTVEHSPGDLSATFEAGKPLQQIHDELAIHGQRLALDPPAGTAEHPATIGGVFATADSGPLSHRYGTPRDLVLGMTIALSDGTIARTGGKVMKNVAGYDLARLFTGSFGTLGAILSVSVRLHPLPSHTATALATTDSPSVLGATALALGSQPLELEALDFAWRDGRGGLLAQAAGDAAEQRATAVSEMLRTAGMRNAVVRTDDIALWERQRAGQRSGDRAVVRVGTRPSELGAVLALADQLEATVVGRAGLGVSYLTLNVNRIAPLRLGLPPGSVAIVHDLPVAARGAVEVWDQGDGPELALMRSVKQHLDTAGVCNPGIFVGGI